VGTPAAEVARLLADAEARGEARVSELRERVRALERERNELEEDWAAKLAQRVRELEALRRTLADKDAQADKEAEARAERDARLGEADAEKRELERRIVQLEAAREEAQADVGVALDAERAARDELAAAQAVTAGIQTQLDEAKVAHDKVRANNKTLRDELRKVAASAQLLEKQRNPGVGYWSASPAPGGAPTPSETPAAAATPSPPLPSGSTGGAEEEVNLEYLRNVILQFLEHREMRQNLVRVLSVILRFTPQELRRLEAKINS
jgi:hypothetical protein